MSKDQMIGGAILAVCVIVAVGFVVLVAFPGQLGMGLNAVEVRLDAVLVLVSIAFIAILSIGAWIGLTMASTPPPKPIQEITAEPDNENKTASKT